MLKQRIEDDLKAAMLGGDKAKVSTLRSLKSAILYVEVAENKRDEGLSDEEVLKVLTKEVKKRQESIEMYQKGGSEDRAEAEMAEKAVIEQYLPMQLSDDELAQMVDALISTMGADQLPMGQIIGQIKAQTQGKADGARIARIVQQRLERIAE